MQQTLRQLPDVIRISRREQQILPLLRQQLDDTADVGDEAHVEHAIRFVEHENLDARQIDGPLLSVIEQPTRRRDQDVGATAQILDLRIDAHAAEDHQAAMTQIFAVALDAFIHLRRELTRRHENQHTRRFGRRAAPADVAVTAA